MALFAKILKKIFHHPCLKYRRIALPTNIVKIFVNIFQGSHVKICSRVMIFEELLYSWQNLRYKNTTKLGITRTFSMKK